jgi:hypothetical protein
MSTTDHTHQMAKSKSAHTNPLAHPLLHQQQLAPGSQSGALELLPQE